MKFYKTIRFRLAAWCSLLLIVLNLFFLIGVNIAISQYFTGHFAGGSQGKMPHQMRQQIQETLMYSDEEFVDINEIIEDAQKDDLAQVQRILYIAFVALAILSFGGGYIISGRILSPIKKINKTTKKIHADNLHHQIEHEDVGDEISEMISNINEMIARLNKSFALQKQFVENASHELKTPLAVIHTNLDSVLEQKGISEQEQLAYIKVALKSTRFMDRLIEDLLLLSLADKDVNLEDIEVGDVLDQAVEQCRVLAKEKRIELKVGEKVDIIIKGNQALLQRAFMNLIENAINYSKEDSKVDIAMKRDQGRLQISITDQGMGIPKDEQEKVFDRFYRVDKSRSRKSGGTGLGLAITKKIVELHHGDITVESEPDNGTKIGIII